MVTKQPRLNVTLDAEHLGLLAQLAAREQKSLSAAARELIEIALELEEDRADSALAASRDQRNTRWISHHDAWK